MSANDIAIPGDTGATLVVDLDAIAENYELLLKTCPHARVGASVKADAYGLGLAPVARTLSKAGCRSFFVATPGEGLALRDVLPTAEIIILNGPERGQTDLFVRGALTPALNSLQQIESWQLENPDDRAPAYLHLDTGMNRLGLAVDDVDILVSEPRRLKGISISMVMSHLACADTPQHLMNQAQIVAFTEMRTRIETVTGPLKASLANSPGIFLGPEYHYDLVRPGAALYGLAPNLDRPNPMKQTVEIYAKILQLRNVDTPMTVGYGAAQYVKKRARIATVAAGYGDGYPRAAASKTGGGMHTYIAGYKAPLYGRVSMDLITLDVSDVPEEFTVPGQPVELLGPHISPDDLGASAGTIGYEILTRFGSRLHRVYRDGGA
ncbi:MAG: alanine racemase [Alphaproteobacteria bacterium]|nr:alanine racemase [Alphaproteobacteria bacterium]